MWSKKFHKEQFGWDFDQVPKVPMQCPRSLDLWSCHERKPPIVRGRRSPTSPFRIPKKLAAGFLSQGLCKVAQEREGAPPTVWPGHLGTWAATESLATKCEQTRNFLSFNSVRAYNNRCNIFVRTEVKCTNLYMFIDVSKTLYSAFHVWSFSRVHLTSLAERMIQYVLYDSLGLERAHVFHAALRCEYL
jgi:hypothetical protein